MGCLVVFSKRSYLGSCTLDHRTTVCNPNRGQRVAGYSTPCAIKRWLVFLLRSLHVSKTREVVQRAVRPCSVSLRGAELVSIGVCDPMPCLLVRQYVSWSVIVPVPILLSAAGSLLPGLLLHTLKQHLPSEEDSCRKHVGTDFSRCR